MPQDISFIWDKARLDAAKAAVEHAQTLLDGSGVGENLTERFTTPVLAVDTVRHHY